MSTRDPYIDPQRGDIVRTQRYGKPRERHVTGRSSSDRISYYAVTGTNSRLTGCSLRSWERWCRFDNVLIVQRGEDT